MQYQDITQLESLIDGWKYRYVANGYYQGGNCLTLTEIEYVVDRVKRIWYLSAMRAAEVQASLRIRAVSPEPPLLTHTSS